MMHLIEAFENECKKIRELDFSGEKPTSPAMVKQYKLRNSFGLEPTKKICRIFQEEFFRRDVNDGYLTLPLASPTLWNDPLENPLHDVNMIDRVTGGNIHLGSLTSSFYALCWTERLEANDCDWNSFGHGKKNLIRVTATVGDLMDRLMCSNIDSEFMHRTWIAKVEYLAPNEISKLKTSDEVLNRIDSTGGLLALSAAIVRDEYTHENEIRLIFDPSINPKRTDVVYINNNQHIRIPFNWNGFVLKEETQNF